MRRQFDYNKVFKVDLPPSHPPADSKRNFKVDYFRHIDISVSSTSQCAGRLTVARSSSDSNRSVAIKDGFVGIFLL